MASVCATSLGSVNPFSPLPVFMALPRITPYTRSPSWTACESRLSTTTPPPSPRA